ncbi:hypothetical protein BAMA_02780 [Bacillus manliponensis]|uniref:Damage-inducible protein DinB n=1 Tax=Bacillus manliponensis TaxID=574376 RepID=A0A073JXL0_9BACI|nr:DinB family protein [Bacillus manliponensis]KEK19011.1 hypothetical protein BAMA_02780 [Bacillus manliponensis]
MYQSIEGFLKSWKYEGDTTQKVLDALTDDSLSQAVTEDHWTLGEIAWHIVITIPLIMKNTGLQIEEQPKADSTPTSAQFIADNYRKMNDSFIKAVKTQWRDEDLKTINDFFGHPMPNAVFLATVANHQNHHRGQMSVLMRQAGLKVPSIYGPTKEDWEAAKTNA